jgi:glycosyltransferase involved in cell wall biosynthesis
VLISHVNKAFAPEVGGVETVCRQYIEVSKSVFDDVEVLTIANRLGLGWETSIENGVSVIRFDYQFLIMGHRCSFGLLLALFIRCWKKKLIHVHDPFPLAIFAFWLCGYTNIIVTYHSDIIKQKMAKWLIDRIRLQTLSKSLVVTTTSAVLAKYSDVLSKINPAKLEIVPIYLDDETDRMKKKGLGSGLLSEELASLVSSSDYMLMIGRMNYYKGLDVLYHALQSIDPKERFQLKRIVIAGKSTDNFAEYYSAKLSNIDFDVVRIDRHIEQFEKQCLLENCHSLLFLSNKSSEAFGIMQLEALSAGRSIVNFKLNTGVSMVGLNNFTAITLPLNDHLALAELLLNKNQEHERLVSLRQNCASHLEKNFLGIDAKAKLVKIYKKFASEEYKEF